MMMEDYIVNYIVKAIKKPRMILPFFMMKLGKRMDDEKYIKIIYYLRNGKKLDLKNPKTFNEKLNWLKLYDRNPLYTKLADKYLVKEFVASVIGDEYVVHNIGVYDSVDDIEWNSLPKKFVIKATHDSSGALICKNKDKFNVDSCKRIYKKLLKRNYYYANREWPYLYIKPRIIIDEFLDDGISEGCNFSLLDYKFWCFNGIPQYMYCTVKDKDIFENFYNMDFQTVDINHGFPRHKPEFDKPKNFEKMVELAKKLATASKTAFVRVDFFNVDGKIYFSEFTFYDWGGLRPFMDEKQDEKLGELIKLLLS